MLRDSMEHAADDVAARKLREQQVEAERVLEALAAALAQDGSLLNEAERRSIDEAASRLQLAHDEGDAAAIKQAMQALEAASAEFVARRMDGSIQKALSGHKLEEFDQG